jgi:hypothetical protein
MSTVCEPQLELNVTLPLCFLTVMSKLPVLEPVKTLEVGDT